MTFLLNAIVNEITLVYNEALLPVDFKTVTRWLISENWDFVVSFLERLLIPFPSFHDQEIPCGLFADDLVIPALSPADLQLTLDQLEGFFKDNSLTLSVDKTVIIMPVLPKGSLDSSLHFTYAGKVIQCVNEFKYLLAGVWIDSGLSWLKHKDYCMQKFRNALTQLLFLIRRMRNSNLDRVKA